MPGQETMQVEIRLEPERKCGHRRTLKNKDYGLYLVGNGLFSHCGRLPYPFRECTACGHEYKHSMGFSWINPRRLFAHENTPTIDDCIEMHEIGQNFAGQLLNAHPNCQSCPMGNLDRAGDKAGLMWVGEKYYKTPADFFDEAQRFGISKRIGQMPRGFEFGKHLIYLAHNKACSLWNSDDEEYMSVAGVFMAFRPRRLEVVVRDADNVSDEAKRYIEQYGENAQLVQVVPTGPEVGGDGNDEEN